MEDGRLKWFNCKIEVALNRGLIPHSWLALITGRSMEV